MYNSPDWQGVNEIDISHSYIFEYYFCVTTSLEASLVIILESITFYNFSRYLACIEIIIFHYIYV
jgi:hypothetical protein